MDYHKTCPVCGKQFTTNNDQTIYCSPSCKIVVKRQRDREYMRAKRGERAEAKSKAREEYDRQRRSEMEERSRQHKTDFERRCAEGDVHALLIREKMLHGNTSRRFWELFAQCSIDDAERAGTVSRALVNGFSVYSDTFPDDVMESIKATGHIITELANRRA